MNIPSDRQRTIAFLKEEFNPHKTARVRELGAVDIDALRAAVLSLPDREWDKPEDFGANYNKSGAIRSVSHIIFRFADRRGQPFRYYDLPAWSDWEGVLRPIMDAAVRPFAYARAFFPRIMLARLRSGTFISPHVDGEPHVSVPHKIHIPVLTNGQSYFFVEDERFHLKEAHAYEINNAARHAAANSGSTDRVHLIFECLDADLQTFTT